MKYSEFQIESCLTDIDIYLMSLNEGLFNIDTFKEKIKNIISNVKSPDSLERIINSILDKIRKYVKNNNILTSLVTFLFIIIMGFTPLRPENIKPMIHVENKIFSNFPVLQGKDKLDFLKNKQKQHMHKEKHQKALLGRCPKLEMRLRF
jgi:hypothetical protein